MAARTTDMLVVAAVLCAVVCSAYKPVIMFHGFNGFDTDFVNLTTYIDKYHPGTFAVSLPLFEGSASEETPLVDQIESVSAYIHMLATQHPQQFSDGYHLVCHSQGALVCRGVLMMTASHGVDTFVSLSGPHVGQYGVIGNMQKYFPRLTTAEAWVVLYSPLVQKHFSAANYWNDPFHQTEFLQDCTFLPILNNLTNNPQSQQFKENFLETRRVVLFGGPDDGVIQPWESAFFGFWQNGSSTVLVPMEDQTMYQEDYIGLRTLHAQGRLASTSVPGVQHGEWLFRLDLFVDYIEPLLT